jgi:urease accessory protein
MNRKQRSIVTLGTLAFAGIAAAHVGEAGHVHGFGAGFVHPFTGLDHLLAMVAVGLWAAQQRGTALWVLPLSFVAAMSLGALAGLGGLPLPMVESGIALSVLVLGLAVATAWRLPVSVSAALVALFALCHGHAHGTELAEGSGAAAYILGFVLATALLHASGIGLALGLRGERAPVLRMGGGAVAAAGLLILVGLI